MKDFDPKKFYESFRYRQSVDEAWRDSICMMACSLQNYIAHPKWEEKEALYMELVKKYSKEDMEGFCKVFAYVQIEMNKNPRDVLGDLYMNLDLGNKKGMGQVFTPDSVCDLMAMMTIGEVGDTISLNEPACGGGATLIAAVKRIRSINPDCEISITAQDLDGLCAQMCFIQLWCLDVEAYVYKCNTLTMEVFDSWIRPSLKPPKHPLRYSCRGELVEDNRST